ncbi:hypothetical protein H0H93_000893 [Arthromyces matolae]|nr:hypothetical protein H0H93_000893 [Arthromyces matolae]
MMMTCQRLWDIGRSVLADFIQNLFAISWAGDRLVVFGDYANIEDLPAGMLNKSEMKWIEDSKLSQEHLWEIIEELQIHNQHRNFNAAQSNLSFQYQLCYGEGVFASSWIGQRRWHGSQIRKLLAALASLVRFRDRRVRKNFFDGRAVFRNLNTKEYICWTSVMSSEPQENELRVEDLSFEHVLYIRTVWSSDPSMAIADGTAVYRGVWAGHRFDVSRIESVQDENGASIDGWKDVSAEVVQEIAAIWE